MPRLGGQLASRFELPMELVFVDGGICCWGLTIGSGVNCSKGSSIMRVLRWDVRGYEPGGTRQFRSRKLVNTVKICIIFTFIIYFN